jgi:hypothetical protein
MDTEELVIKFVRRFLDAVKHNKPAQEEGLFTLYKDEIEIFEKKYQQSFLNLILDQYLGEYPAEVIKKAISHLLEQHLDEKYIDQINKIPSTNRNLSPVDFVISKSLSADKSFKRQYVEIADFLVGRGFHRSKPKIQEQSSSKSFGTSSNFFSQPRSRDLSDLKKAFLGIAFVGLLVPPFFPVALAYITYFTVSEGLNYLQKKDQASSPKPSGKN